MALRACLERPSGALCRWRCQSVIVNDDDRAWCSREQFQDRAQAVPDAGDARPRVRRKSLEDLSHLLVGGTRSRRLLQAATRAGERQPLAKDELLDPLDLFDVGRSVEPRTFGRLLDPGAGLALLDRDWRLVKGSHLLEVQVYRNTLYSLCARTTLAAAMHAEGAERQRLIRRTKRFASGLRKTGATWAIAVASLLEAGVATLNEASEEAEANLRRAEGLFGHTDMRHYLAATRYRLSQLRPELSRERDLAERWIAEEAVRNADRLFGVFAPGRWS